MKQILQKYGFYFAWVIALSATLISLYSSEVLGMQVCNLCWYQRICMYPLVVILGIATYRSDDSVSLYVRSLVVIGFLFSTYQYVQQMFPEFSPIQFCGTGPSCNEIIFQYLGFITYPFLSMAAFAAVFLLITIAGIRR